MSVSLSRTPVTPSPIRSSFCASCRCVTARPRSYSCMPASKMPTTVNALARGMKPIGVTLPSATSTVILSPMPTPSSSASSLPSTMSNLPGCRSDSLPAIIFLESTDTSPSRSGNTPRNITPCSLFPCSIASRSTYGAAPITRLSSCAMRTAPCQSGSDSPTPLIVACATMLSRRVRYSSWKPVITAIVVINAIIPTAIPRIDTAEMKEMKPVRRLARV